MDLRILVYKYFNVSHVEAPETSCRYELGVAYQSREYHAFLDALVPRSHSKPGDFPLLPPMIPPSVADSHCRCHDEGPTERWG